MQSEKVAAIVCAASVLIAGTILLFYGCRCDPAGEIDASVLVAYGEILTFAGALLGIKLNFNNGKESKPKTP